MFKSVGGSNVSFTRLLCVCVSSDNHRRPGVVAVGLVLVLVRLVLVLVALVLQSSAMYVLPRLQHEKEWEDILFTKNNALSFFFCEQHKMGYI